MGCSYIMTTRIGMHAPPESRPHELRPDAGGGAGVRIRRLQLIDPHSKQVRVAVQRRALRRVVRQIPSGNAAGKPRGSADARRSLLGGGRRRRRRYRRFWPRPDERAPRARRYPPFGPSALAAFICKAIATACFGGTPSFINFEIFRDTGDLGFAMSARPSCITSARHQIYGGR